MAKVTTQNKNLSTIGGDGLFYFQQIQKNATTGAFEALTGADAFGDAAGTLHLLGTHEESGWDADDKGIYKMDATIFEDDTDRLNMISDLAPFSESAGDADEEAKCEDGTKFGGADTADDSRPYFITYHFLSKVGGKRRMAVRVAQFERAWSRRQKYKGRNRIKATLTSINADGFTPTLPADAIFSGFTAPALDGNYRHGKIIQEA